MKRICLAFGLFASCVLPSSAASVSKTYSYFSVGGVTLDEIETELARRGPQVGSTGRRHPGATQMEFTTRVGYAEAKGGCAVVKATVSVKAKVILPKWRRPARAESDVRLVWDTLASDIRRHEESHVGIARTHARELEMALLKMRRQKNCTIAAEKAQQLQHRILADHDRAQGAFDRVESVNFERRIMRLMTHRLKRQAAEKPN